MAGLDDIFDGQQSEETKTEPKTSKEEWREKREQARTEAFDLLETATGKLTDPAAVAVLMDVISKFDRYSVSNTILIADQMPSATRLADFTYWQEHEVNIKKGEHAITILEPREYTKADGTNGISYEPKKVFDISQTTAEAAPKPKKQVDAKRLIKALTKTSPVEMWIDNSLPEGIDARFSPDTKTIAVRQGLTGDEIFRALSQEISKARAAADDRRSNAFAVAAVSYILCRRNDVTPPALPEKSPFEDMEPKDIRGMLKEIREEANNTQTYYTNVYTLTETGVSVANTAVDFLQTAWEDGGQEIPAFYTISALGTFVFYDGEEPWTNAPLRVERDLEFWGGKPSFDLSEKNDETWCAWIDNDGYGIGLYTPIATRLLAGRFLYDGTSESDANPTNYVAPLGIYHLNFNEPFTYLYHLTSGTVEEIRDTFKALH